MIAALRLLPLLGWLAAALCAQAGPPNVLLLFADDLRADVVGAFGGASNAPAQCSIARANSSRSRSPRTRAGARATARRW